MTLKDKEFTNVYKIKELKHIICEDCYSKKNEIPEGWSTEAADFVNRVLNFYLFPVFRYMMCYI